MVLWLGIDWSETSLWLAVIGIAFPPTYWNILSHYEYNSRVLTKAVGGKYAACYTLAATIFVFSLVRDWLFEAAMHAQPDILEHAPTAFAVAGYGCIGVGGFFVLATYYQLGITGTYLGDRCGIYMDAKIEDFPFNVLDHPMYTGATLAFLGQALRYGSPAGLFLTGVVALVYAIAESIEGPFTNMIYAKLAEERSKGKDE